MNMTEKEAQGNPAQPGGWAQGNPESPDAHPNGELLALEEQKRAETAAWEDQQNRSPMDYENPAQPAGFAVPAPTGGPVKGQGADAGPPSGPVVAKVFASKTAGREEGSKVLLGTDQENYSLGEVIAVTEDKFWVAWRDGDDTIEKKGNFTFVIRDDEDEE